MVLLPTEECPADPVFGRSGPVVCDGLHDALYGVPGRWRLRRAGGVLWLDPRPRADHVMEAYTDYHTHASAPAESGGLGGRSHWYQQVRTRVLAAQASGSKSGRLPLLSRVPPVREQLRFDGGYLGVSDGKSVLDVGCGRGDLVQSLQAAGWRAKGIDPDPSAVEAARALGRDVALGDAESIAALAETFDAVVMYHVLEHLYDPLRALQDVRSRLKPGGRVVVVTPNADSACRRIFGCHWRGLEPPRHLQIFTRDSLRRTLQLAGLHSVSVRTSARDASGMFCASHAIKNFGNATDISLTPKSVRLKGDLVLAAEVVLTGLGIPVGEELVALAESPR